LTRREREEKNQEVVKVVTAGLASKFERCPARGFLAEKGKKRKKEKRRKEQRKKKERKGKKPLFFGRDTAERTVTTDNRFGVSSVNGKSWGRMSTIVRLTWGFFSDSPNPSQRAPVFTLVLCRKSWKPYGTFLISG